MGIKGKLRLLNCQTLEGMMRGYDGDTGVDVDVNGRPRLKYLSGWSCRFVLGRRGNSSKKNVKKDS